MSRHGDVYLIPGARAIVQRLQRAGFALAIATNKGSHSLQRALTVTGLEEYFKVTRCADQVPPKPCPQMLEEILDEFLIPVERALMIGDSISDIEMAKAIGMEVIGVNFYHKDPSALMQAGALDVINHYDLLADYLQLPD
jgi:phosphoglycolate phosphatase